MHWTRIAIAAGLLAFTAQTAEAAAPPRTMDLEILANGKLLLRGELIESMDNLEAKLRIMRENQPPFELSIRLPKTIDAFAPLMKLLEDFRLRFGPIGNPNPPKPLPAASDSSTI
jgi:hypothetical protein